MTAPQVGGWRRLAFRGIAAGAFGVAVLVWAHITLWALVLLWGAFVLVDGLIALSVAISDRFFLIHRGWLAFYGVVGMATGVVTFAWPSITARALLVVIAVWALLEGVALIGMAVRVRKFVIDDWLVPLAGVLAVLLGVVLLLSDPSRGALAMSWAIGWFACIYGVLEVWLALLVREETS
jgi:uncharacterized membrane protein HdeD (DUF308 family)